MQMASKNNIAHTFDVTSVKFNTETMTSVYGT